MKKRKNTFLKTFVGDKALKRYNNELRYAKVFPTLTPKVISADNNNLRLQLEFLDGDNNTFTQSIIKNIGKILAQIHKPHGLRAGNWNQSILLSRYQKTDSYFVVNEFQKAKSALKRPRYSTVHGDFRRRNIFISKNDIARVIDWEFAGQDIVYWDLAIFLGDMRHQRYHKIHNLDDSPFISEYLKHIFLTNEEVNFCRILGGLDVILDHIEPRLGEKPPEPHKLFLNFGSEERDYLMFKN